MDLVRRIINFCGDCSHFLGLLALMFLVWVIFLLF